jgi:cytoskeletal protein RodZ
VENFWVHPESTRQGMIFVLHAHAHDMPVLIQQQRRTAKFAPPPAAAAATKPAVKTVAKPAVKVAAGPQPKAKDTIGKTRPGSASEDNASGRSTPQSSAGTPTLKRADSKSGTKKSQTAGDLFKSFAKAKPKAKDAEKSKESMPADDGKNWFPHVLPATDVARTDAGHVGR